MAARNLTWGELISGVCALALLVLALAVPWYGVDGIPGQPGSRSGAAGTQTGWEGLTDVRWLILITVLVAFATLAVHAAGPARQTVAALRLALLALAWATALLLVVRVLIDLPSSDKVVDQKLGALIGLGAALGLAMGASQAIREQRLRLAAAGGATGEHAIDTGVGHPGG
ncbi:MAG TPA: hypothetical protein VMD09_14790 [Solirubrobacteraceae bacterium]|nr:hypothetical protein [Solirubrobacteraceae bacterium]